MTNMDDYVRKQEMLTNLKLNLSGLHEERFRILNKLLKVEQMILKHENFIGILEEEE